MTTHRPARTAAALAVAVLATSFASAGAASASTDRARADAVSGAVAQQRALSFHPTLAIGTGKRKVRFLTCKSGTEGNYTVHYKATTRKSSDRTSPRIVYRITEGGSESGGEFSLFPGDLTETSQTGLWSSAAEMRITLRLLGKVKKKELTVGAMGAC